MKRIVKNVFLVLLLISLNASVLAKEYTYEDSNYLYYGKSTITASKEQPIYETQTLHSYGTTTTITVTTQYTKTQGASSNLSLGGSVFGVTVSSQIGVSQSEAYSVTAGVSYTIPRETPTGLYRITTVFPGSYVYFFKINKQYDELVFQQSIAFAPNKNQAYKKLERYN